MANLLLLVLLNLSGCSPNKENIIGKYAAVGYVNTSDTIMVNKAGIYERKIYDKNKKLALQMQGKWEYDNGLLVMTPFFLNLDRDIVLYPEILSDTSMRMEVLVEKTLKGTRFCTGYLENEYCYKKIN